MRGSKRIQTMTQETEHSVRGLRSEVPLRQRPPSRKVVSVFLLVMIITALALIGCGAGATPTVLVAVSPTVPSPLPSDSPSPTATTATATSRPPTLEVEPTVTGTDTPSPTPSVTPTTEWTASVTPSRSPSPTASRTPRPRTPGPTNTATTYITPTLAATLTPTPLFTPTPLPTVSLPENVLNILLIGLDSRSNLRGQNTDVIIVVSINKDTKQVSMLSIPRDLWVYIPTHGWSRINVAHRMGFVRGYPGEGPGLLKQTILVNFGIPIDKWVRIDFTGFRHVVDELGGVDMVVPCRVNLLYQPPGSDDEEEMILEPGIHHMDGATALRYVRTRRGGSDFDRARRQQQFLRAMWDQTKSPDILPRIPGLWAALSGSVETDLTLGDLLSLAPTALEISPQRIRNRYIGPTHTTAWVTSDGWQVLLPNYTKIQQVVASLYAPPSAGEEQAAAEGARIQVRNGTYRFQLAQIAADQFRWHGLNVVDYALADNPDYAHSKIIVYNEKPKTLELLIDLLDVRPENVIRQPDPNQTGDIQVILGNDYDPCQ